MTTLGTFIRLQEIPSSQLHLLPEILNEEFKNKGLSYHNKNRMSVIWHDTLQNNIK